MRHVCYDQHDITKHEEWFEHLGYWDDALLVYKRLRKNIAA